VSSKAGVVFLATADGEGRPDFVVSRAGLPDSLRVTSEAELAFPRLDGPACSQPRQRARQPGGRAAFSSTSSALGAAPSTADRQSPGTDPLLALRRRAARSVRVLAERYLPQAALRYIHLH